MPLYAEDIRRYRLLGDPVPLDQPEGRPLFADERLALQRAQQAAPAPPAVVAPIRPAGVPEPVVLPAGDPRTALREAIAALPAARERVEAARGVLAAADEQIAELEDEARAAAEADEKRSVGLTERMRRWLVDGGDRPEPPPAAPQRLAADTALKAARDARALLVADVAEAERQHDIAERAVDAAILACLSAEAENIGDRLSALEDQARELRGVLSNVAIVPFFGRGVHTVPLSGTVRTLLVGPPVNATRARLDDPELRASWQNFARRLRDDPDATLD